MENLKALYQVMRTDRRKERYEMILEPFQALVQLALLSFCPVGSRLAISNNLLSIQMPCFTTSLQRSYYQDTREDLVYLFGVITRFHKFYNFMIEKGGSYAHLHALLVDLSKKGLDKIIQTYTNTGNGSLIQQLKMYKVMLGNSDSQWDKQSEDDTSSQNDNIDGVFIQIRQLYNERHMVIVLGILELIQSSPNDYVSYMDAVNSAMQPSCVKIHKWIHENIIL